jgi:hypothetical protein
VTPVSSKGLFLAARLGLGLGYEEQARRLLEHLLTELPSHLAAHCLLGHRYLDLERQTEAREHFEYVLRVDPLYACALKGIAKVELTTGLPAMESNSLHLSAELYPFDGEARELLGAAVTDLGALSMASILSLSGRHSEAVTYFEAARTMAQEDVDRKAYVEMLLGQELWAVRRKEEAGAIMEGLHQKHPSWVRPKLILADLALQDRDDALGVSLLHDARALDASGAVATELLGPNNSYSSLLDQGFEVEAPPADALEGAPQALTILLTGDEAPQPQTEQQSVAGPVAPEAGQPAPQGTAKGAKTVTSGVGATAQEPVSQDSRDSAGVPPAAETYDTVRLVMSSRRGICARYGEEGYQWLDGKLCELGQAIARSTGDETIMLYIDDEASLTEFGLRAVEVSDPCQIAGLLEQIDAQLRSGSRRVQSLLIVGGDKIIPFHRLANPADDDDPEVISDWPYAADEHEPLLARFAVGRLPDNEPADFGSFLGILDRAVAHHNGAAGAGEGVSSVSWRNPLRRLLSARSQTLSSIGYTAEVWAEASRAVFGLIGDPSKLHVSPPATDYDFLTACEQMPALSYFNLHGFRGSPYWYGHGESEQGSPLLPVALTPLSISWTDAEGSVVYSEACYGADLEREYPEGSIPVNFLRAGALGFIGSTSMSYGTLAPPLSGADLLGMHLWEGVLAGLSLGDALRRARAAFMQSTAKQQGYLDGEDQKALQSFVLYGDPSLSLRSAPRVSEMEVDLEVGCPPLACCSRMMDAEALPLPKAVSDKVRRSLPFVEANGLTAHPLILCRVACTGHGCGTQPCGAEQEGVDGVSALLQASQRQVVTKGAEQLQHMVKVTVNADGEVLKVLVSRGGIRTLEGGGS